MKILIIIVILLFFIFFNGISVRFIRNMFILFYVIILEDINILMKLLKVKKIIYDKKISLGNLVLNLLFVIIICFVFY